jgi:hypothetical protein
MLKLICFAVLLVGVIAALGTKLYGGLMKGGDPKAAAPVVLVESGSKGRATEPAAVVAPGAPSVRVVTEIFAGFSDERRTLHKGGAWVKTTTGAQYTVGEICEFGFVESIRSPDLTQRWACVSIRDFDGARVFVIAQDSPIVPDVDETRADLIPVSAAAGVPSAVPGRGGVGVAGRAVKNAAL